MPFDVLLRTSTKNPCKAENKPVTLFSVVTTVFSGVNSTSVTLFTNHVRSHVLGKSHWPSENNLNFCHVCSHLDIRDKPQSRAYTDHSKIRPMQKFPNITMNKYGKVNKVAVSFGFVSHHVLWCSFTLYFNIENWSKAIMIKTADL